MDKINKVILKIPDKQRKAILATAKLIRAGKLEGLNLKKLTGSKDLFRVRMGRDRIIIKTRPGKNPIVIDIAKRDEKLTKISRA